MKLQGTPEWRMDRLGKVTGSRVFAVVDTDSQGKPRAAYDNLLHELVMEQWTGEPTEHFQSAAMKDGTRNEPIARILTSLHLGCDIREVGFANHPVIPMSGTSLDGIIDEEKASVEFKCPLIKTHMGYWAADAVPPEYMCQIQWGFATYPELTHCYFVSYNKQAPRHMRLYLKKVEKNPVMIQRMEERVGIFVQKMQAKLDEFKSRFPEPV